MLSKDRSLPSTIISSIVVVLTAAALLADAAPLGAAERFRRADSNADGTLNIADTIHSLGLLFRGSPDRIPCEDAADSNDDGELDISDAVVPLLYLFLGASEPPPPFGDRSSDCGEDPTADDLGCESFAPCPPLPPAAPVLVVPRSPTRDATVLLRGTAGAGLLVKVTGGLSPLVARTMSGPDGAFAVEVELFANRLNRLFAAVEDAAGRSSAPATVEVIQDLQPPFVYADEPADGATVFADRVAVTGRVSDMLSGFQGLAVTVNGAPAAAAIGIGTNGTFERQDVPLALGENTVTVVATDAVGNSAARELRILREEPPLGSDRLELVSGNGQAKAPIHATLPQPIVVRARKADGTPLEGKLVTFRVARSDGRLASRPGTAPEDRVMMLAVLTDADGLASARWTLGSDAGCGNNRVRATGKGLAGEVRFCASAAPGPAAQINIGSGQSQRGEAGAPAPEALRAWVSDGCNGVPSVPVAFRVVQGAGNVNGADSIAVLTGATGHAQASFVFGPEAGNQVVEADFAGNLGSPALFLAHALLRDESRPTTFTSLVLDNAARPIQGAVCILEVPGFEGVQARTTLDGRFTLEAPGAGPASLSVEGSFATHVGGEGGEDVPAGSFPALTYEVTLVPNAENSLPSPVLLPPLDPENAVVYDGVTEAVLHMKGIEGLEMVVAAGTTVTLLDGTRVGPGHAGSVQLSLNQVHQDDIPMPMPDGAAPPVAWTLQPRGATFDPPLLVRYPNVSALPPGAIANFLTFNHDTERFEVVSSGTVSADGSTIVSDPGSGIRLAGWGGLCPPYPTQEDVKLCVAGIQGPSGLVCVDELVTITGGGGPAPGTLVVESSGEPAAEAVSFGDGYGSVQATLETRFKTPGKKTATATWSCSSQALDVRLAKAEFTVYDLKLHPIEEDFGAVGPRVMISTTQDDRYNTVNNTTLAGTPAQTKDGEVTITFHGEPVEELTGEKVYFRVVNPDPDDRSPYETASGAPDNRQTASAFGPGNISAKEAVLEKRNLNGKEVAAAEVILTITPQYAGDNYQVEASLDSTFSRICARTAVMVAWKRVYLEEDNMYLEGATLTAAFAPDADGAGDVLQVDQSGDFTVGELVMVFSPTASLPTVVTAVAPGRVTVGDLALPFPKYSGIRPLVPDTVPIITDLIPATYGGDTRGTDGGAFVEFVKAFAGSGPIPKYTAFPNDVEAFAFCQAWFQSSAARANVVQLVGALGHVDGSFGTADSALNISFVTTSNFSGNLEGFLSIPETVCHEIAHQFDVANSHVDAKVSALDHASLDECVMSYNRNRSNLIAELDLDCMYDVRDAVDPR